MTRYNLLWKEIVLYLDTYRESLVGGKREDRDLGTHLGAAYLNLSY